MANFTRTVPSVSAFMGRIRFYLTVLLLCVLTPMHATGVAAKAVQRIETAVSARETTPGQLIWLSLSVYYDEGVEALFQPTRQPWGDVQLQEYRQSPPLWQNSQWLTVFTLQMIAPVVGEYHYPELSVDFYRGADHWQLSSVRTPLRVRSAFGEDAMRLQSFEALPLPPEQPAYRPWLYGIGAIGLFAGIGLFRRRLVNSPSVENATTAVDFAAEAQATGYMNWDGLRQWLMRASGCDPLGQLTTSEPLLLNYQHLRFNGQGDPAAFIALCQQCQERWP